MPVRKNAKFLSAAEREAFVRACVMMKADIVNPAALPANQYSRWDEMVAVHWMIQDANMPGQPGVNFGHGGLGAFSFLPWHRLFLQVMEQRLQSYVPGVMIPYWDWTNPVGTILVTSFLGPNGDPASGREVRQGYFAREAPGTGINATPAPLWWPAGLTGWNLHAEFGTLAGALRRNVGAAAALPSVLTLRSALDKLTYSPFQNALESGSGTVPLHQLHNALHTWFGGVAQMSSLMGSPFDPMFYLHHCNIDRLWAQWQMDGHATEYPAAGGDTGHHLADPMYPFVGALAGYSTNNGFATIAMADFSALGVKTPADVLDHRAMGYCYDTQAVIGVSLDRTGSMTGMTPDPMTMAAPDVTKWEAAKRGVSAFLQDCEVAYASTEAYVVAGVKTFRSLGANEFAAVFAGTPYGLVKAGSGYSRASFDAAIVPVTPGGGTPLADALLDTQATLVAAPFGSLPADERRYLAMLTDGMLTTGAPLASIGDGSLATTAVFAMGFGTGADVDYATLAALVAKGQTLSTQQVFHGENAGVIDKFYSQALAAAMGFAPVMDPVLELFDGEHSHFDVHATSAEDAFFITAQGMDYDDPAWSYQLVSPAGRVLYADGALPPHAHGAHGHGGRLPVATARRGAGRLSLIVQRDNADDAEWLGLWSLLVARNARDLDAMVMQDIGHLLVPVGAGPTQGPRWSRLLVHPKERKAVRAMARRKPQHRLDTRPTQTNSAARAACSVVVNIYARTRLRMSLLVGEHALGKPLDITLAPDVLAGTADTGRSFARMLRPRHDLRALVADATEGKQPPRNEAFESDRQRFDATFVLAGIEKSKRSAGALIDEEVKVVSHHGGPAHVHLRETKTAGEYHLGLWIEGVYVPEDGAHGAGHGAGHAAATAGQAREYFTRLLTTTVGLGEEKKRP